ncbi:MULTISPECIES: hypothetical protein [unclassified Streptomyces]|uniref:hypothetical protein n=1 Tax=unclassified Streptomyces TaxID=2593676 RepID=UPI00131C8AE4|nr:MULTISPECIES: hypothetical protein [unclassified Streptomyces]MYX18610.1 hypothetical protein [Streptomyces sp. SID8380]
MRNSDERTHYIAKQKKSVDRKVRVWVQDGWQDFEVFRVPVDALLLNVDNRRFRAEKMWAEEHLGRQLDPENYPIDELSIGSLLLDVSHRVEGDKVVGKPGGNYEALKNDWLLRKQESPLWIRPDGTVRNGNRRLSMIKRLQKEIGSASLERVEAIILLESEIDEPSLLEMEQREQLTENFKVRYNDIDYLLALREAAEIREVQWHDRESIESVAGELQSMVEKSKGEVVRDLFAVKYMDLFLEDSEQPGQYHRLLKTLERFRDIGRMMMQVEEQYPMQAAEILQTLFAAVRAGKGHLDIRSIRAMFKSDRSRFDELASKVAEAEAGWDVAAGPSLSNPGSSTPIDSGASEDEPDVDDEGPGPDVANYPKIEIGTAIDLAIDAFSASQQDDVAQVLLEVCNRLEVLTEQDRLGEALTGDDGARVRGSLTKIVEWADVNRHLIEPAD